MVPRATVKTLQPEDLQFLKLKGCFSLPSPEICKALVRSYFLYVHPGFPILDDYHFWKEYMEGGAQRVNLLLLWSMFSVSSSYIDDATLQQVGHKTRREMKQLFVKRAKYLFDLSGEDNKIVLIQSALLMSFWFSDPSDITQSWHWTGIAVGIAQTLGLHRDPDARRTNVAISDTQRSLWRRIWWSCVFRDCWLALGMGRPLRISMGDCDCPMPTMNDISLTPGKHIEDNSVMLDSSTELASRQWINLIELTKVLHQILNLRYRPNIRQPKTDQFEKLREGLEVCLDNNIDTCGESPSLNFSILQLRLHQQAALIALFRLEPKENPPDLDLKDRQKWRSDAAGRVRAAAITTNSVLLTILATDDVVLTSPMSIALVVPAMHSHLLESKSTKPLTKHLGLHKIDLCLKFLSEVEENYPAAAIIRRLFAAARDSDDLGQVFEHKTIHSLFGPQPEISNLPSSVQTRSHTVKKVVEGITGESIGQPYHLASTLNLSDDSQNGRSHDWEYLLLPWYGVFPNEDTIQ